MIWTFLENKARLLYKTTFFSSFLPTWDDVLVQNGHGVLNRLELYILYSHCYFTRLNLRKMGPLQFCLPVFLGIHRNPKQSENFDSCAGIWPKKFSNSMQGLKSAILAIFREGRDGCALLVQSSRIPWWIWKILFAFGCWWIPTNAGRQN